MEFTAGKVHKSFKTKSGSDVAISLYEKHGFTEVGRIPNAFFRKNEYSDQVIMVKELPAR